MIPCELALLAIGFIGAEKGGMVEELKLELDERGNIKTENYMTIAGRNFCSRRYPERTVSCRVGDFRRSGSCASS